MKKVCSKLGLHFRRFEDDARAVLKEKCVANLTKQQLKKALDELDQEHHVYCLYTSPTGMENY